MLTPDKSDKDFSVKRLNLGRKISTKINERKREKKATTRASPRNCLVICGRTAPMTLRIPTSLARLSDRAVVKFIKLMQAMINMKTAIREKI